MISEPASPSSARPSISASARRIEVKVAHSHSRAPLGEKAASESSSEATAAEVAATAGRSSAAVLVNWVMSAIPSQTKRNEAGQAGEGVGDHQEADRDQHRAGHARDRGLVAAQ